MAPSTLQCFDPLTLRLFVAVCEEGNIARAAAREAIVASAVSKRIAALERAIGTALLVRGRRGVEPTAAGQALLRHARGLLATLQRMASELAEFATGVLGSVRVAASMSVLAEHLPDDIAALLARVPRLRVSLDEYASAEVVRRLHEGAVDLGVLWDAADLAGLHTRPYRSDTLGVALPATHRLAARRALRFDALLDEPLVGVGAGGLMDTRLRRQAALRGRNLAYRITAAGIDAGCRIVGAGLGIAILPRDALQPAARGIGVVLVPLDEPWATRRFVVASRGPAHESPPARLLAEHLAAAATPPPARARRV